MNNFKKFATAKKGSAIKEQIRQDKRTERKEKEAAIGKHMEEKKQLRTAQRADDPRNKKKEFPERAGKTVGKSTGKSAGKTLVKSTDKAGAKPAGKVLVKPAGKTPAKAVSRLVDKTDLAENTVIPSREFSKERKHSSEEEVSKMPLNKYIAHGGICSRRDAAVLVKEGKVTVNGTLATEPGMKINPGDVVKVGTKKITPSRNFVYILLNKPKDYITTLEDPQGRKTVLDLVKHATTERVYPVGRLDRNTSGVLLLTNDGDLAQTLAHPKFEVKKIYHVGLDKPLTKNDFDKIMAGLSLEDGVATVDVLAYADSKDKTQIGIEIHSGKNRIVRRIFEHLGYDVRTLDRVTYAGLTKKNVQRGKWRLLTEKEVRILKFFNAAKMAKDPTRTTTPVKAKKKDK